MKYSPAQWALIGAVLVVVIGVIGYFFVPFVRYKLIPVTGGTRAPESFGYETTVYDADIITLGSLFGALFGSQAHAQSNKGVGQAIASRIKPGMLADKQKQVTSIDQVPDEGGWINSLPLDLKELQRQGYTVLIDFWTYTCINCIRAIPHAKELWDRYKDQKFVIIGVHSPEFKDEGKPANILAAVKRMGITYPVLTDAHKEVWRTFGNHFWPGKYLINPKGEIIYTQFGEGNYAHEEQVIRKELEKYSGKKIQDFGPAGIFLALKSLPESPELYAGPGFIRRNFGNKEQPRVGREVTFALPGAISPDEIYLSGTWAGTNDYVESVTPGSIVLRYTANTPYIVLDGTDKQVEVLLDGKPLSKEFQGRNITQKGTKTVMALDGLQMYYPIAENAPYGEYTITFNVPPSVKFYSFTFGTYKTDPKK